MRLIAERVLRATAPENEHLVYLQGEVEAQRVRLRRPLHVYHMYCSQHNVGEAELAAELQVSMVCTVRILTKWPMRCSDNTRHYCGCCAGSLPTRSQGPQAFL